MIRTLVADSYPILRDALCAALARDRRFHALGGYSTGRSVLDALAGSPADALLVDLGLPDIAGVEVVRHVRVASPATRILVFGSAGDPAGVEAAVGAGAHGYVLRQHGMDEVLDAIGAACGGPGRSAGVSAPAATRQVRGLMGGSGAPQLREGDLEIIARVVSGQTDQEIAQGLYVSARTVQNHLARIRRAAGVARRPELARWAIENSLV